jgi:hypothetical protein
VTAAASAAEVKAWVREILGTDAPVLVSELHCRKRECPGVETVVAVMAPGEPRRWSVPVALAELTREALARALAEPTP